jgi:hypothetical protein
LFLQPLKKKGKNNPELVLRMISEGIVFKQVQGRGVKLVTIEKEKYLLLFLMIIIMISNYAKL